MRAEGKVLKYVFGRQAPPGVGALRTEKILDPPDPARVSDCLSTGITVKAGIGTPQILCLLMHQSERSRTIFAILSFPQPGIQDTLSIWSSASFLKAFTETNHWSVALKITGFLHLQQWG
jgi:hypothetical protein